MGFITSPKSSSLISGVRLFWPHFTMVSKISSSCVFQESCFASSITAACESWLKSSEPRMCSSVTISSMHLSCSFTRPYCTPTSNILQACSLLVWFCKNCTLNWSRGVTSKRTLTSRMASTFSTSIATVPLYIICSIASKAEGSTSWMTTFSDKPSAKLPQSMLFSGCDHVQMMFLCALKDFCLSPLRTTNVTSASCGSS
mmetsp:Transcript_28423/g.71841  ORF Transcript_28423/g.71841 Transcript_28423/m.71841 type:complete len:200 (+) Transcript_28423:791-1390(+)